MEITIERVDDINIIMRGTVKHSLIEEKAAEIEKLEAASPVKDEPQDTKPVENALNNTTNDTFEQKAQSQLLKDFINQGIEKAGINVADVLGQPGFKKFEKQEDFMHFEVGISTSPVIDTNVEYADIIPPYAKPKADSKDIEAKLLELSIQQAPFTKLATPRAVVNNDVVVIDFKGFIDGKPFDGGTADGFTLRIGSNAFIPGFEEQIIGMNYNEEKTITVHFPKDYNSEDLAGKETQFSVTLHEIQEQKAMQIDDSFAKRLLNTQEATLDTLKEKLGEQIAAQELSKLYNNELKPKVIKALLTKFDFTLPSNIVEQEIDAMVNEQMQQMSKEELAAQKDDKEKFHAMRDSVREDARTSIKSALIIDALARKEGIKVGEEEVIAALNYQASLSGQNADELVKYYRDNNLMTSAKIRFIEDKLCSEILGLYK